MLYPDPLPFTRLQRRTREGILQIETTESCNLGDQNVSLGVFMSKRRKGETPPRRGLFGVIERVGEKRYYDKRL